MKIVIDPTQLDEESLRNLLGQAYTTMALSASVNCGLIIPAQVVKIHEKMFYAITEEMDNRNITYQDSMDSINSLTNTLCSDVIQLKDKYKDELEGEL